MPSQARSVCALEIGQLTYLSSPIRLRRLRKHLPRTPALIAICNAVPRWLVVWRRLHTFDSTGVFDLRETTICSWIPDKQYSNRPNIKSETPKSKRQDPFPHRQKKRRKEERESTHTTHHVINRHILRTLRPSSRSRMSRRQKNHVRRQRRRLLHPERRDAIPPPRPRNQYLQSL
jgi:hypothetical protein